jgi:hypothetical protein
MRVLCPIQFAVTRRGDFVLPEGRGRAQRDGRMETSPLAAALPSAEFVALVAEMLGRYCVQNSLAVPAREERVAVAERLRAVVLERGLPRPLAPLEHGAPGELSDAETTPLVARVMAGAPAVLATPVKQLVKACFYPEFRKCRESYCETEADGSCRRQELARGRTRVSGAHCVDCPYWVAFAPERHESFLVRAWRPAGREEFAAHREIFLPEDFRELRLRLHAAARAK